MFDFGLKKEVVLKKKDSVSNIRIDLEDWSVSERFEKNSLHECVKMDLIDWDKESTSGSIWTLKKRAYTICDDKDLRWVTLKEYHIPDESSSEGVFYANDQRLLKEYLLGMYLSPEKAAKPN